VARDPVAVAVGLEPGIGDLLTRDKLAAVVLPVPDPMTSLSEARKHDHLDLGDLDGMGLWRELHRAELAVQLEDRPDPWRLERLDAVSAEAARRRGGS